jgi:hypothetical protein
MNRNGIKLVVLVTVFGMLAAYLSNVYPKVKISNYEVSSLLTIYPAIVILLILLAFRTKKKKL